MGAIRKLVYFSAYLLDINRSERDERTMILSNLKPRRKHVRGPQNESDGHIYCLGILRDDSKI